MSKCPYCDRRVAPGAYREHVRECSARKRLDVASARADRAEKVRDAAALLSSARGYLASTDDAVALEMAIDNGRRAIALLLEVQRCPGA